MQGVAASPGSQFWRPSFTFKGQESLMAVTFLVYWYGTIFISQTHGKNPILYVLLWDVTSPVFNLFLGTRLGCEFQHGTLAGEREWIQLCLSCLNFHGPVKNLALGNCISLFHYSFPRLLYLFIPQADIYSFLLFSHCLVGYQICMNPFFPSLCAISSGCCYFSSLQ